MRQKLSCCFPRSAAPCADRNAQAIYNLGYMTQMGQGTPKDNAKALKYYEDASNKGYAQASYRLAQIYETGELGVAKDSNKFSQYVQKHQLKALMMQR